MSKGGDWEIEVARRLTEWMKGERNPPELWRSRLSGGWQWRDVADVGDLRPNGELGREFRRVFGVECKHHKDINFYRVFSRGEPVLLDWWEKLEEECQEYKLAPVLVIKMNFYPPLAALPRGLGLQAPRAITIEPGEARYIELDHLLGEHEYEQVLERGREWCRGRYE